jgi:hypothetical protein
MQLLFCVHNCVCLCVFVCDRACRLLCGTLSVSTFARDSSCTGCTLAGGEFIISGHRRE